MDFKEKAEKEKKKQYLDISVENIRIEIVSFTDSNYMLIWYQGQKVKKPMQACLQEDFWLLDPPKTWVSSHFSKKNERIMNVFEDCESAKHVAIWDQGGQK